MAVTDRLQGYNIGTAIKVPCYVATNGTNLTLEGAQTVDGISVGASQRVLVKDQTDVSENGIYVSQSSTWVRAKDCDGAKDLTPGTLVYVDRGTANADSFYVFNSSSTALTLTPGTDDLTLSPVTIALSNTSVFSQSAVQNATAAGWRSTLGVDYTRGVFIVTDSTYGALRDGTDDSTSIQNAIAACIAASGGEVILPPGKFVLAGQLSHDSTVAVTLRGAGHKNTILAASTTQTSLNQLLSLGENSDAFQCFDIGFETSGSTARCVTISTDAEQFVFMRYRFTGELDNDTLCYSAGQFPQFTHGVLTCNSSLSNCLNLAGFNQNGHIAFNRIGGTGRGINVSNAFTAVTDRVEGLSIVHNKFVNTAEWNVQLADCYGIHVKHNVLDQARGQGVNVLPLATRLFIEGNHMLANGNSTSWEGVQVDKGAGPVIHINHNEFNGGSKAVQIAASSTAQVSSVQILGNTMGGHADSALDLNSVDGCKVKNNHDKSTPTNGSWVTRHASTASPGVYHFGGNTWHTVSPQVFSTLATYYWDGYDTGIVMKQVISMVASDTALSISTDLGLSKAPNHQQLSAQENLGWLYTSAMGATSITATWTTSSTATITAKVWV